MNTDSHLHCTKAQPLTLLRSVFFLLIFSSFFITHKKVFAQAPPQQAPPGSADAGAPTFKLSGAAELMNNYVNRGLTETDKDPALQAAFWFNFGPQFRMGLWGSNVGYEGSETRFLLRANADVKISFSQTTSMNILIHNNNYFKPEGRNGWIYGAHIHMPPLKFILESESNWAGTLSQMNYFGLGYEVDLDERWKWPTQIGYSQIKSDSYSNYIDFRTGIHYKSGVNIRYKLDMTGLLNNAAQFNGRGAYAFILAAMTEF
jgi:uncharacterized protein (TIGR02001 family)